LEGGTAEMYWESALSSCVQVAIGLTGFSGIIAALRLGSDTWTEADRVNLEILLGASGFATLFSLVPFVALDFLPPKLAWNILSFVYASVFVGILSYRVAEFRRGKLSRQTINRIIVGTLPIVFVLGVNGWLVGASWLYVAVVVGQLVRAFLSFVQLLRAGP
jgi:hypothetical protein